MTPGFLALTLLFALLAVGLWVIWRSRNREATRARAAEGRVFAMSNLLDGSEDIAHDVGNLLSAAFLNLEDVWSQLEADPKEARVSIDDVTAAIHGATEMLNALRCSIEDHQSPLQTSCEGYVRLHAALFRSKVGVQLQIDGNLPYYGEGADVSRILGNLFENAAREAQRAGGGIEIYMSPRELRVSNRVQDSARLNQSIYERGTSENNSTGLGLSVCKKLSPLVGWKLDHSVNGETVTFRLRLTNESILRS